MASNVVIDKKSEADVCKWLEIYIHGDKRVTVHNVDLIHQGDVIMKTLPLITGEFGLWIAAGDRLPPVRSLLYSTCRRYLRPWRCGRPCPSIS